MISPWELDGISNDNHTSWRMDPGLTATATNCLFKILKYVNQKKGGVRGLWAKIAFCSFDSVLKVDQLAPNHRSEKVDGYLMFLDWPFGFQKTMTSYGLGFTQWPKRCPFFGTCLLLTALHMLGLFYLRASVSQPSLSQVDPSLGWICNWFSATAWKLLCWIWLYRICIMKATGILICFFKLHVSPVMIPTPLHPILRIFAPNQCS